MSLFSALGRPDPTPWLLGSAEPAARWVTLTALTGAGASEMVAARAAVLEDPSTQALLALLPDWETDNEVSGHDKPLLATNLLDLLHSIGVRTDDDLRIGRLLDQFLAHTDADGRFQMFGAERRGATPRWGALLCDTHAIVDILLAFERADDPRVRRALETSLTDLRQTDQGVAWPCRPSDGSRWRGPGRAADCCPQTTLEALRAFSRLPADEHPAEIVEAARTVLSIWSLRGSLKPYMFGHGRQFKQVKWPPTWYGAYEVVEVLGRLPEVWNGPGARDEDRRALTEIAACLLAYNVAPDGTVTPLSVFSGLEGYSFGQKKQPSPLTTALLWAAVKRLEPLAPEIAAVDVLALSSSKGGTGVVLPPAEQLR
jgi:hypothetical protein